MFISKSMSPTYIYKEIERKIVTPVITKVSVVITGDDSVDELETSQYRCLVLYSDGSTVDVSTETTWSLSNDDEYVATINQSGLLSAGDIDTDTALYVEASHDGLNTVYYINIENIST